MFFVISFTALLFIALSFILTENNAKTLLAGYNTMSEEERKTINIKSFISFFKSFHLYLGLSFFALGMISYYFLDPIITSLFLGIYPIVAYIYFMYASPQYMGEEGKKSTRIGIYVLFGVLGFVLALSFMGLRESPLIIQPDALTLKGMYGETVAVADIEEVAVVSQLPKITQRRNGFAVGEINKGYFKTDQGETIKLVLNSDVKPFLYIQKKSGKKIYYADKAGNTAALYNEIKNKFPELGE